MLAEYTKMSAEDVRMLAVDYAVRMGFENNYDVVVAAKTIEEYINTGSVPNTDKS